MAASDIGIQPSGMGGWGLTRSSLRSDCGSLANLFWCNIKLVGDFGDGAEAKTMLRTRAEIKNGALMGGGSIANMFAEAVAWVFCIERGHVAITLDFSNNGGGRHFFNEKISFFERGNAVFKWGALKKIYGAIDDDFEEIWSFRRWCG